MSAINVLLASLVAIIAVLFVMLLRVVVELIQLNRKLRFPRVSAKSRRATRRL